MGLYMPLPLSLLSHSTYFVILLSNPVNWPSWAAWLFAPINTSHNVFGGWWWSHTLPGCSLDGFFWQSHQALSYTVRGDMRISSISQRFYSRPKWSHIYGICWCFIQSEIVKTLWSHSNSYGIARCTWLSVEALNTKYLECFYFLMRSFVICS